MEYGFRMEIYGEDLFVEEVAAENIVRYKVKNIKFIDQEGKHITRSEAIVLLADYIKKSNKEFRRGAEADGNIGRTDNGRFLERNISSNKFYISEEEVYLLYMLCGTMEKAAEALGVCRQTVSKNVNQYKKRLVD